ncbi:MAG TPA: (d)CMP kinase [Mycobacteriales bacterium]|nr:(d)CMP kinase [Mycobacteriales bacterium]
MTGGPFTGVIALDGPSGTGKSTVACRVADALHARFLDTGAMYRAATVAVLRAGDSLDDPDAIAATVSRSRIDLTTHTGPQRVEVDGSDVTAEIRGEPVTLAVSAVSAVPAVRQQLVAQQQALIGAGGIVVEGRDIGTVVAPDAELKIFLTAHPEVRASRRSRQAGGPVEAVAKDMRRRDTYDSSRAASPLRAAADAVEVDTSELSIDEVVGRILALVGVPR